MSSLLFAGQFHTGLTEDEAQSTVEPIRTDGDDASAKVAPEWNEIDSDESGQLVGLSPRVVGSVTEPSGKQTEEAPTGITMGTYETAFDGNQDVSRRQASNGTAAAREEAGQFGHGSIQTEIGIEPLNPAQEYGNDYFAVPDPGANYAGGAYMTPAQGDNWPQQVAQARATTQARANVQSTLYTNFFSQD
jgi:hypothetical protein